VEMLSTLDQLEQFQLSPSEKVVKAIKLKAHSTGLQKV